MAACSKKVDKGVVSFPCIIAVPSGSSEHEGPCAATEHPSSIASRRRWEEGEAARALLAETQSPPQTFADRNAAHSPTPVPGSDLQPKEYREAHRPVPGGFGEQGGAADDRLPECQHPYGSIQHLPSGNTCRECGAKLGDIPQGPEILDLAGVTQRAMWLHDQVVAEWGPGSQATGWANDILRFLTDES